MNSSVFALPFCENLKCNGHSRIVDFVRDDREEVALPTIHTKKELEDFIDKIYEIAGIKFLGPIVVYKDNEGLKSKLSATNNMPIGRVFLYKTDENTGYTVCKISPRGECTTEGIPAFITLRADLPKERFFVLEFEIVGNKNWKSMPFVEGNAYKKACFNELFGDEEFEEKGIEELAKIAFEEAMK